MTPVVERFVLHWGEMGSRWGVNRSVAQIHALLYLSPRPLAAEEISQALSIARSNVSTSLKELAGWDLLQRQTMLGDRREHFTTHKDPWDLFFTIVEQRKRREIDPILDMLARGVKEAEEADGVGNPIAERLKEMHGFVSNLEDWYHSVRDLPRPILKSLISLGDKVTKVLPKKKNKDKD